MINNKLTIEFLVGLSCSGKSTYSVQKCLKDLNWVRVNKDDIRAEYPSGIKESKVIQIEEQLIQNYLDKGFNIVLDNTHLNPVHLDRIKKRFSKCADIVVNNSFLSVPLDTILNRADKRPETLDRNGNKISWRNIVMNQKNQFLVPKKVYEDYDYWYNNDKPKCIVVDMDGNLAIHQGRSPFDFAKCVEDMPNAPLLDTVKMFGEREDVAVIILSGRPDDFRSHTESWLNAYGVKFDAVYMRKAGDGRKDVIVKEELYNEFIKDKYNVYAVYDDRRQVVEGLWTRLGLPVFAFGNPYHDF